MPVADGFVQLVNYNAQDYAGIIDPLPTIITAMPVKVSTSI